MYNRIFIGKSVMEICLFGVKSVTLALTNQRTHAQKKNRDIFI